jgi:hypothetical protein
MTLLLTAAMYNAVGSGNAKLWTAAECPTDLCHENSRRNEVAERRAIIGSFDRAFEPRMHEENAI